MKNALTTPFILVAGLLISTCSHSLETDQFYAWNKPINDSREYLNAWVQLKVQSVLDSKPAGTLKDCESAAHEIQKHLQHSIYQPIELWIISSDLVDRIPRGEKDNYEYRSQYLLSNTFSFDYARLLQPSPTLEVNNIRFGSDKLAHFFSEGWWYYRHWKKVRGKLDEEKIQREIFNFGVKLEKSIQGSKMTGVFSPGDLEANYQGFLFYRQLCHAEKPLLYRTQDRWHFAKSFDFSDYIAPEWDESWNPNVYSPKRWQGIRTTMATYCPMLNSDWVKRQRTHYAKLDTLTPTEGLIQELVATDELPDPGTFDVTSVCE